MWFQNPDCSREPFAHSCGREAASHGMRIREELIEATCTGNLKLLLAALRRGANPNASYRGRPVITWAIQERHLSAVRALARAGASLDRKDDLGFTPLDQAVGEGDAKIVRFLLHAGANVNRRSANGTPLHTACAYRHFQIAKLLLAHGAARAHWMMKDGRPPP
jgi:ankyrin repeat protein